MERFTKVIALAILLTLATKTFGNGISSSVEKKSFHGLTPALPAASYQISEQGSKTVDALSSDYENGRYVRRHLLESKKPKPDTYKSSYKLSGKKGKNERSYHDPYKPYKPKPPPEIDCEEIYYPGKGKGKGKGKGTVGKSSSKSGKSGKKGKGGSEMGHYRLLNASEKERTLRNILERASNWMTGGHEEEAHWAYGRKHNTEYNGKAKSGKSKYSKKSGKSKGKGKGKGKYHISCPPTMTPSITAAPTECPTCEPSSAMPTIPMDLTEEPTTSLEPTATPEPTATATPEPTATATPAPSEAFGTPMPSTAPVIASVEFPDSEEISASEGESPSEGEGSGPGSGDEFVSADLTFTVDYVVGEGRDATEEEVEQLAFGTEVFLEGEFEGSNEIEPGFFENIILEPIDITANSDNAIGVTYEVSVRFVNDPDIDIPDPSVLGDIISQALENGAYLEALRTNLPAENIFSTTTDVTVSDVDEVESPSEGESPSESEGSGPNSGDEFVSVDLTFTVDYVVGEGRDATEEEVEELASVTEEFLEGVFEGINEIEPIAFENVDLEPIDTTSNSDNTIGVTYEISIRFVNDPDIDILDPTDLGDIISQALESAEYLEALGLDLSAENIFSTTTNVDVSDVDEVESPSEGESPSDEDSPSEENTPSPTPSEDEESTPAPTESVDEESTPAPTESVDEDKPTTPRPTSPGDVGPPPTFPPATPSPTPGDDNVDTPSPTPGDSVVDTPRPTPTPGTTSFPTMPVSTPPPTEVPVTPAPTVVETSRPTETASPTFSGVRVDLNDFAANYLVALSRNALLDEVDELTAITEQFLDGVFTGLFEVTETVLYNGFILKSLTTSDNTDSIISQGFEASAYFLDENGTVIPEPPDLQGIVVESMEDEAYITVLQVLPDDNIFATATNVTIPVGGNAKNLGPIQTENSSPPPEEGGSSGASPALIASAVCCSVGFVAILAFVLVRRHKKKAQEAQDYGSVLSSADNHSDEQSASLTPKDETNSQLSFLKCLFPTTKDSNNDHDQSSDMPQLGTSGDVDPSSLLWEQDDKLQEINLSSPADEDHSYDDSRLTGTV